MAESKLENLVARLEKVVLQLEGGAHSAPVQKSAVTASLLPSLEEFNGQLKGFEELGKQLDLPELQEIVLRRFLIIFFLYAYPYLTPIR